MATIVLLAYKEGGEREPLAKALEAAGHRVVATEPKDPEFRLTLRGLTAVDAVVVDLSANAAHGREAAGWICLQRRYRGLPVLLTGVRDGEEALTRAKVPCARRVSAPHIAKAVAHALTPGGSKGDPPSA